MKYFAYGSNMLIQRLKARVPSANSPVVGSLSGYSIMFHKRGDDGSGKCSIIKTGHADDIVYGVIFEIADSDKLRLDRIEGVNKGYNEITIQVNCPAGLLSAFTYIADANAIDNTIEPYDWYKSFVVAGARQHQLPLAYQARLESANSKPDLNNARVKRNGAILKSNVS